MIWYRHWLEIRGRLVVAAICVVLIGVFDPVALHGAADYFARTGKLTRELDGLLPVLGAGPYLPCAVHAWLGGWIAIVLPVVLAGSGLRTQDGRGGLHPSTYYTLALPVSRPRLVCTRFLAGFGAAVAALTFSLALHCAGLLLTGYRIPLAAMAFASLCGALVTLPILGLQGFVTLAAGEFWASIAAVALWVFTSRWNWASVAGFVFSRQIPWPTVLGVLTLAGLFLRLTVWLSQKMEFSS